MAVAAPPGRPVSLEDVHGLLVAGDQGPLPSLQFFGSDPAGQFVWRVLVYVLRVRGDGFMVAAPAAEEVVAFFSGAEVSEIFAVQHVDELQVETTRGRQSGSAAAVLIDVPGSEVGNFRRPVRGTSRLPLFKFEVEGVMVRPNRAAALRAAEEWIAQTMDEDTAGEYGTAGSELEEGAEEVLPNGVDQNAYLQLQAELDRARQELAARARADRQSVQTGQILAQQTPGLLGSVPPAPASQTALERLRMLAGPAPSRIGQVERQARIPNVAGPSEVVQQEQSLEVLGGQEVDELEMQMASAQDPMQRLVLLQMQQLKLLTQQLTSKQPQDAIHAALGSGGDSSTGSSAGIKGCLAREAYIKISSNLVNYAQTVEQNALQELGHSAESVHPGLMRDYVEKRLPLGNMRLLTQMAYLASNGWEVGARTGNRELQGFAAKLLCFAEQTALDEGRTGLSWLLTGLPEPNYAVTQRNVVRYGAKPFSRLSAPSWIAANVGYLKDLEFLDSRIKATDKVDPKAEVKDPPKNNPNPRPRRRKPKGGADAGDGSSAQS